MSMWCCRAANGTFAKVDDEVRQKKQRIAAIKEAKTKERVKRKRKRERAASDVGKPKRKRKRTSVSDKMRLPKYNVPYYKRIFANG